MATDNKPIVGTGADDTLQGTAGADVILGAAGNDVLHGLAGNDRLAGGNGADELDGEHRPVFEVFTTFQPYPAESVVWIRIAPAAPRRDASSYLYVQRP